MDIYADTGTGLLGTNMFAYCDNNPVMNIDPTGYNPFIDFIGEALFGKLYTFLQMAFYFLKAFSITAHAPAIPREPSGYMASRINSKSVRISWNAVESADYYEAQIYNSALNGWIADYYYSVNTATSYTNKDMRGSNSVRFRVRAVNRYGESNWVYITYHKS